MRTIIIASLLSLTACTAANKQCDCADGGDAQVDGSPCANCGDGGDLAGSPGDGGASGDLLQGAPDLAHAPDPTGLPAYCSDVLAAHPASQDGPFTLYVNKDMAKPWTANCVGMQTGAPLEYLPVKTPAYVHNVSTYIGTSNTKRTTSYVALRIDPGTLTIDINDDTFYDGGPGSGALECGSNILVNSMPLGTAMNCNGAAGQTALGYGQIDLTGTPFSVTPRAFALGGTPPLVGSATYNMNGQLVELLGGGSPGWIAPKTTGTIDPINANTAGARLQLTYGYVPPDGTMVCSGATVDTETDNANCGECGHACDANHLCGGGFCKLPYGIPCTYNGECASNKCVGRGYCFN